MNARSRVTGGSEAMLGPSACVIQSTRELFPLPELMSAAGGMIREVAGLSSGPDGSSLTYSQQTRVSGCWTTWERRARDGGSAGAGEREAASVMTAQPGGTGFQVTPAASDR